MPKDFLKDAKDYYDVVVIGSGLAGLTAANVLGRAGYSVLLLGVTAARRVAVVCCTPCSYLQFPYSYFSSNGLVTWVGDWELACCGMQYHKYIVYCLTCQPLRHLDILMYGWCNLLRLLP